MKTIRNEQGRWKEKDWNSNEKNEKVTCKKKETKIPKNYKKIQLRPVPQKIISEECDDEMISDTERRWIS